ncbi:unnamed protein product [Calicophoron daubneyi]|uniref:NADP-dependent oxidoreductase domain-containing protein n=1 Tax=Calicophoron daubneyi TaxID=300641 RepID=A0AAV2T0F9_CALDB
MVETLPLYNGQTIPTLGLGTYLCPPGKAAASVQAALEAGYRHFDCAYAYENEKEIGEALEEGMKRLNIKREDIFVTSKLWCTCMRPERVRKACEKSLSDLRLSYLDLYLMHWPFAFEPCEGLFPIIKEGDTFGADYPPLLDTWKAMEQLVDDGLVRSIGVSNFNHRQIDRILEKCRIRPANLQVEIHANFPNAKLVKYAQSKGLTVTAYRPLGRPDLATEKTNLLLQPWVTGIAKKHNKTPAQVLLRWLLQREIIVIPKSVTPARIVENSKIFDFTLTPDEMEIISTSGLNERGGVVAQMKLHPEYPFNDEF